MSNIHRPAATMPDRAVRALGFLVDRKLPLSFIIAPITNNDGQMPVLVTTYAGEEISAIDDSLRYAAMWPISNSSHVEVQETISQDSSRLTQRRGMSRRSSKMYCLHGKASIIDFSHAFVGPADDDLRREDQKLEDILAC
jgi:hypothetical protein